MKKIYLNLKRFDIPRSFGGINSIGANETWAKTIMSEIEKLDGFEFTIFFQESSIMEAMKLSNKVSVGCQSVFYDDVSKGGNFGAFTSFRTAKSMEALGVKNTLIGHCEERNYLNKLFTLGGGKGDINEIFNQEVKCAINANMKILYCVGEKLEEQPNKYEVIKHQLLTGLKDVDVKNVTIAYEPVWAIGPGRIPPDKAYIEDIVKFIKSVVDCEVVYGGGLKVENAKMLASIKELDGGLVALTTFGKDFGFSTEDFKKIINTYKEGL